MWSNYYKVSSRLTPAYFGDPDGSEILKFTEFVNVEFWISSSFTLLRSLAFRPVEGKELQQY